MDVIDNPLETSEERDVDDMLGEKEEIQVTAQGLTIVEDDASLGSSEDQTAVVGLAHTMIEGDDDVQYFRPGNGSVTYKVVQLDDSNSLQQIVSSDYTPSSNLMHQAVLTTGSLNGPLYVIGSPSEVFGSSQETRTTTPRQSEPSRSITGIRRDDRRRATHNEVERRRRDKINTQILELSKIIPGCVPESAKSPGQSKGGILSKACKHIIELQDTNAHLSKRVRELSSLNREIEQLKRENENLREENSSLRAQLNIDTKVMEL